MIQLPAFVTTLAYVAVGFVVVCLLVLAFLKWRNRRL